MKHDVGELARKVELLDKSLARLVATKSAEKLIPIFRRPGWTTPAEFALVAATLQALQRHVEATAELQEQLIAAADQVARQ
jgi:hypothetical protein